jgi:hypothetical protein
MNISIRAGARLAGAALLGASLLAPPVALAAEGNPPGVECAGYAYYLKIDNLSGGISAGSYSSGTADVTTNWPGQTITVSNVSNGGQDFDWASTKTVSQVVAKEGSEEFVITTGLPGKSGSVASEIQQGLSHVTFCGGEEPQPTPTPTPEPTPTPTPEPTPTPTPEVTSTPEPVVTPTPTTPAQAPTPTPTSAPTGTVEAATGTPKVTPPSTDAGVGGGSSSTGGLPIVLIALAGILATSVILLPRRAKR